MPLSWTVSPTSRSRLNAVSRGLDRKSRVAIAAVAVVLLAGPGFLVGKYVAKALSESSEPIASPHADNLVSLRGVTLHVERGSHAHQVANWLQLNAHGEQ